jgi:hypothetical protein
MLSSLAIGQKYVTMLFENDSRINSPFKRILDFGPATSVRDLEYPLYLYLIDILSEWRSSTA